MRLLLFVRKHIPLIIITNTVVYENLRFVLQ